MNYFDSKYYGRFSNKVLQLLFTLNEVKNLIRESESETVPINDANIRLDIIKQYEDFFLNIFMQSLDRAIQMTEYKRNTIFITNIKRVISNNIHSLLNEIAFEGLRGGLRVMRRVAGNWSDFYEGVEQARSILNVKNDAPPASKAKFWKEVVWPDDTMYDYTVNIRVQAWGELAPYWLFVEYGNFGRSWAYPKFSPTNFFSTSVQIISNEIENMIEVERERLKKSKEDVEFDEKEWNVILQAQARLIANPEDFNPGDILGTVTNIINQKKYKLRITPTWQLGAEEIK